MANTRLRIMTYNIQHGHYHLSTRPGDEIDLTKVGDVIRAAGADVIALNEVRGNSDGRREGYTAQAETLAAYLGYHSVFGRAIYVGGDAPYGNAVLSRWPIVEVTVYDIPDPEPMTPRMEHRALLRAVVELPADETPADAVRRGSHRERLALYVTHFGLSPAEAASAAKTVLEKTAEEKLPFVVMGDFNLQPDSPILAPLYEALTPTDAFLPEAHRHTFPSHDPSIKIDYIFTGNGVTPIRADSPRDMASDHCPIWCDVNI